MVNDTREHARQTIEQAFRESEERLRFVLEHAHVGLWDWDFATQRLEWSTSCKRLFGFADDEEVTYGRFLACVHPDDRDQLEHGVRVCIAGCGSYDAQYRMVRGDGSIRWLHVKGDATFVERRATRLAGIVLDVTERRRAQEELSQRERLFRALVTAAGQSVWLYRPGNVPIESLDEANRVWWCEFTGQTNEQRIARDGRGWLDVVHPEDRDAIWGSWQNIIIGEGPMDVDFRVRRFDGEWRWLQLRGTLVPTTAGAPPDRAGTVIDVTEQRAAEHALRQRTDELEATNRAKDEFLATVSHELRSPLQGMLGWLALLKGGQLDAVQTQHALESVERGVRLQAQLVHDIMDISRVAAGTVSVDRTPLDLASLVTTTVEEMMPGAVAKNIKLSAEAEPCGLVMGDHERLHQVIANLLCNALKFTPAGGRVTVACRRENGCMLIEVADTGQGIDAEFLPHVFDRFTQADASTTRRHGGLGLGLAIVRHLVELQGGTVGVDSAGPGCGTTFHVHLPLALPETAGEPVAQPHVPDPCPRLDGIAVLLVEDDRDTLDAMTMALEAMGARVSAATSALEAFSAFSDRAPDVVVSDIGMPQEDGYTLLRRIREARERRDVPAIALTGFTRPEDRERALSAGFAAHVAKPVDPDRFVRILVDVLRERRGLAG